MDYSRELKNMLKSPSDYGVLKEEKAVSESNSSELTVVWHIPHISSLFCGQVIPRLSQTTSRSTDLLLESTDLASQNGIVWRKFNLVWREVAESFETSSSQIDEFCPPLLFSQQKLCIPEVIYVQFNPVNGKKEKDTEAREEKL